MSATVEDVATLADVDKFLQEMAEESTHGQCHAALTWLSIQIRKAYLPEYNIRLCVGFFAGRDHSWMQIIDPDSAEQTIVDMTVNQFGECHVPYVGPISPGYVIHRSVMLCDDELHDFIESLG